MIIFMVLSSWHCQSANVTVHPAHHECRVVDDLWTKPISLGWIMNIFISTGSLSTLLLFLSTCCLRPGHTRWTHEERTRSTQKNGLCTVVHHHSLLVRRARCTIVIRDHSLGASSSAHNLKHIQNCAQNSTHKCTHQKDAKRMPDMRGEW